MLTSAAVCPHPPLLVPEVAGEAAPELDTLRRACLEGLRRLDGEVIIVVGCGAELREHPAGASGSLRPYGVDLVIGELEPELPLSLTVGRWLLEQCELRGTAFYEVPSDASPEVCLALGRDLADRADSVSLLVMGDGSACRDEKAPGYLDPRSAAYDAKVAEALARADAATLAALDPDESRELMAAGRAAWQVLAGAAGDRQFRGELLAAGAPYGVGYFAATWT